MKNLHLIQKAQKEAGEVAKGMLEGSIDYLIGAFELSSLFHDVDVAEDDEDFLAFVGVASSADHLPLGEQRKFWSQKALDRHESEIQEVTVWAKKTSLIQCKSLVERFNA